MSDVIPLGERENLRLEFKGADALKDPEKIAREVVAMLNAEGGSVWVGLREDKGFAVEVESIGDPDTEKRKLLDFLVDTIEPSLGGKEIEIQSIPVEGKTILRLNLNPSRKPYALLRKGGLVSWVRIEDRIRPMDWGEIGQLFGSQKSSTDELDRGEKELKDELDRLQGEAHQKTAEIYWLRIKPVPSLSLDLVALKESDLLVDPTLSGNRRTGKNFTAARGRPAYLGNSLAAGSEELFQLWLDRNDGIRFRAPLKTFHAGVEPGAPKPLYWVALLEFPVSVFRLLSKMLRDRRLWEEPIAEGTVFLASVAILGLRGWSLRPFSPSSVGWLGYIHNDARPYDGPDFTLTKPLRIPKNEVEVRPDRCGFRLAQRIYEAFGYGPEEMPAEFDQKAGRLVLPE